mmetsp:Transcript_682/g.2499  ORF Transcript_682/g.2499 Transcript_682/m.2499 type:complete len:778 (+) Transcript_682:70-2403(+)
MESQVSHPPAGRGQHADGRPPRDDADNAAEHPRELDSSIGFGAATSAASSLFTKALDVLEPLQTKALDAIDASLGEYEPERSAQPPVSATEAAALSQQWEAVAFEEQKPRWEAVVDGIAQAREAATSGRRKLVEMTRKARARPEFGADEVKKLVLAYQHEIDALTKRAGFSEGAFSELYELLHDLDDPADVLRSTSKLAASLEKSESEVRGLQKELDTHQTTAADMKQVRLQLRRTEARCKELEAQNEKILANKDQRSADDEAKLLHQQESMLQQMWEQERHVLERMKELEAKTKEERQQRQQAENQLFELQARFEEERQAKQLELDLLAEEVDRAQTREQQLELELGDQGRANAARMTAPDASLVITQVEESNLKAARLESALQELEDDKSTLSKDLASAENALVEARQRAERSDQQVAKLLEELAAAKKEIECRPRADELEDARTQICMLKELVDTDTQLIERGDGAATPSEGREPSGAPRLDSALKEKARKASADLTKCRHQLAEANQKAEASNRRLADCEAQLKEKAALLCTLEADLATATALTSSGGATDDPQAQADHVGGGGSDDRNAALLSIVCSQRERYKSRLAELEESERRRRDEGDGVQRELEKLRSDNLALYEKIKYLESYQTQDRKAPRSPGLSRGADLEASANHVEMRYRKQYEDSLNPFSQFKVDQQERHGKMRYYDRITLRSGKFILTHRLARAFIFFYTIALHVFVFGLMYHESQEHVFYYQALPSYVDGFNDKAMLPSQEALMRSIVRNDTARAASSSLT